MKQRNRATEVDTATRVWSVKLIEGESQTQKSWMDWWYKRAAPPVPPANASLEQRELARRGRLTSIILFFIIFIVLFLALPVGIFQNQTLIGVIIPLLILMTFSIWLNRRGNINLAGAIVTFAAGIGIPIAILLNPAGLSTNNVFLYDMMIQSDLIAVSLLPARSVFLVAALNIGFVVSSFLLIPHTADLDALTAVAGPEVLGRPIALHIIVAVVTYLWVVSSQNAIKRAERAQTIAELEHDLAKRDALMAQEKQKLEASIDQILLVLNRVAQGDIAARVPLSEDTILWQVVGSVNNLLSRYQKAHSAEVQMQQMQLKWQQALFSMQEYHRLNQNLARLGQLLRQIKGKNVPFRAGKTGTALDEVLQELDGLYMSTAERGLPGKQQNT